MLHISVDIYCYVFNELQKLGDDVTMSHLEDRIFTLKTQDNAVR